MTIFVIDDQPFALRLVGHQLGRLGYQQVVLLQDPREAIARLEADVNAAEMVLLDLQMPDMDGIEVIRHLARLRYGGGLVLVSGEDERILQTAFRLARSHRLDIRGALHKPVTAADLEVVLGTSQGVARAPAPSRRAYPPDRVRAAISGRELVNLYQPKVSLRTGAVLGVETLVRWRHPDDGLVGPDQFVEVAEEHGIVEGLTRLVLEEALAQARRWEDAGLVLHVGVNVSMECLMDLRFPEEIMHAIAAARTAPERVVLEVTESRLMRNPLAALDVLSRLRLKHVSVSIDDFGTGHSSLAQLRDIPFDELKVDRGFVHGAHRNPPVRAILEASLSMGRQLGMRTVAEGIEDVQDWRTLQAMGCDVAQGYFVGRPMEAEMLERWVDEWEARRAALVAPAGAGA